MLTPSIRVAAAAVLAVVTAVTASPLHRRAEYSVKDTHIVPRGWTNIGAAPPDHVLSLHIGLSQARVAELERHLLEGRSLAGTVEIVANQLSVGPGSPSLWPTPDQ